MEVGSSSLPGTTLRPQGQCGLGKVCLGLHIDRNVNVIQVKNLHNYSLRGGLAQLARALAWHARGHRFDPDILHLVNEKRKMKSEKSHGFFTLRSSLFTLQRSLTY